MQWLKTFSLVIRSNVSALVEQFEDPERTIHQLIIDMEDELERIRANVAGVIADEILLGKQVTKAQQEAEVWQDRVLKSLQRKDDGGAQAALEQKLLAAERAAKLEREYQRHKEETAKLHHAIRDLEGKIREARHKRALLAARMARADSARTIHKMLQCAEGQSALAQFERLEARVERAEAVEEAYQRMQDPNPQTRELAREFEERERKERLQREFDELKRRLEPQE